MKNKINFKKMLSPTQVLKMVKQTSTPDTSQKQQKAEQATAFYSEELFDFQLDKIEPFEVDLSEFAGEI
jgi:hypothetical protein